MIIPFRYQDYNGRVFVAVEQTTNPPTLGANDGSTGLANCRAALEFDGRGYLQLFGWIQLVRSSDNSFQGRQFEMDPFDPFKLYERAPLPYCWYGILPTLFDAPSRDERGDLDWLAHSFLAVSPVREDRRVVMPLLGFSWGFRISAGGSITLEPVTQLTTADWESHLPYLHDSYPEWSFTVMAHGGD